MKPDNEYVSSATLIVLGDALDPDVVSTELLLSPSRSWRKGEQKEFTRHDGSRRVFDSRHEWGGWKLFMDPRYKNDPLETQLQFWCEALQGKSDVIAKLKSSGLRCILDIFVTTDATASIVLSEDLLKSVASLGLEIELSIVTDKN
jgi:hypothetical protein